MKNTLFLALLSVSSLFFSCTEKMNNPNMANQNASNNKPAEPAKIIQVADNQKLKGVSYASNTALLNQDGIVLFSNGAVTFETDVKPKKKNTLVVEGLGSFLKNEPVKIDVIINDNKISQIDFSKDISEVKNINFKSDKSKLVVQLNFVNDYYNKETKEDRNFILKSISIK